MEIYKSPKMVVMMNSYPDMTALSIDIYEIYKIKKQTTDENLSEHFT